MRSEIQTIDRGRPSFIEAARRAQIIDCAIEAIADLRFVQASLAQIAKRARVSTGVISYYFAGKDDLIRAVGAHVYATGEAFISPLVDQQTTARDSLRTFIEASVGFLAAYPKYPLAVMNINRSGRSDSGAPRIDPAVDAPRKGGFQRILEWGQRTGEFRPFAVQVMVATIVEALDAIPHERLADPNLDLDAYAAELVTLFDLATRSPLKEPLS